MVIILNIIRLLICASLLLSFYASVSKDYSIGITLILNSLPCASFKMLPLQLKPFLLTYTDSFILLKPTGVIIFYGALLALSYLIPIIFKTVKNQKNK